jgi:hypothetical protein
MPKYFKEEKVDILLRRYPPQIAVQGQEIVSHQIDHFPFFLFPSYQLKLKLHLNQRKE